MNPLTNVRNVQKMNERELELGLIGKKSWHDQYKDSAWIFIGGLPYDLTEGDVIAIFSQYGELVNINLVRDGKTGKSKGFCFLCYEDQRSTVLAVDNLNGIKVLGRIIRVDHVENYKVPKEHGDEDEVTKKLRMEGIAPKPEEEEDDEDYVVPMKKHKSKKEKKTKKKKKEKKQKEKEESDSDSEDKSAKHRKLKSHHSEKDKPRITGTNPRSEYSKKDTGYRGKEHSVNDRNYSAVNLQDDRGDRSGDRSYHRKESHNHEDRYRNDHKRRHDEKEYYSNREYRQESEQSDRRHKYDHGYRDRR